MKKLLLGSAALIFLSAGIPAFATDMPIKAPVYKAAAPFSWEGFYAGVHAGYGWGTEHVSDATIAGTPTASFDPKGWLGGFQLGNNSMIAPNWLLGSEVDFSAGDIRGNAIDTAGSPERTKIDYFGTARARLGYVFDRSLIYVTGGIAWSQGRWDQTGAASPHSVNDAHVGLAVGGGLEYAFDPRWSAKIEYLYADLGSWREVPSFNTTLALKLSTVRVGLNYRFGDPVGSAAPRIPVKAYAPSFSWSGSYIGVHAGYGWGDYHVVEPLGVAQTISLSPKGWLGGFQTGYNWQFAPAWIFGLETDNSFGDLKANGLSSPGGFVSTVKVEDFGTVRARLGYTVDRAMFYATGGLAYARQEALMAAPNAFGTKFYDIGWVAGGGIEYMFAPRWSAKLEYLYADLGRSRDTTAGPTVLTTALNVSTVRAGLNYQFDLADFLKGR